MNYHSSPPGVSDNLTTPLKTQQSNLSFLRIYKLDRNLGNSSDATTSGESPYVTEASKGRKAEGRLLWEKEHRAYSFTRLAHLLHLSAGSTKGVCTHFQRLSWPSSFAQGPHWKAVQGWPEPMKDGCVCVAKRTRGGISLLLVQFRSEGQLCLGSRWRRGSGRKEKFRQPLKDSSYKGRVLSQVLISVSQSNLDSYKYSCSFLNAKWHCEYSSEKQ